MKDKDVIEGNKIIEWNFLIAKFMGWTYPHIEAFKRDIVFHESHNYDTRWDKLMPVVEKIESDASQETGHITVQIAENYCRIYQYSYIKELIKVYDPKSKINSVWQAVVQFIQWYNQTKPNSNSNPLTQQNKKA